MLSSSLLFSIIVSSLTFQLSALLAALMTCSTSGNESFSRFSAYGVGTYNMNFMERIKFLIS